LALIIGAISTISIAAWISQPTCKLTIRQSNEAVLRQNLDTLRHVIDAYTYDKRRAPQSLEDLVVAGYLRRIPVDPTTNQADWRVILEDIAAREPGIADIRSASSKTSTRGTPYNTW